MKRVLSIISIYMLIVGSFALAFGCIDGNLVQVKDNLFYIDFGFYLNNFSKLGNQFKILSGYWNLFNNFHWTNLLGQLIKLPFIILYYIVLIICYFVVLLQYVFVIILPFGAVNNIINGFINGLLHFLGFVQSMGW